MIKIRQATTKMPFFSRYLSTPKVFENYSKMFNYETIIMYRYLLNQNIY